MPPFSKVSINSTDEISHAGWFGAKSVNCRALFFPQIIYGRQWRRRTTVYRIKKRNGVVFLLSIFLPAQSNCYIPVHEVPKNGFFNTVEFWSAGPLDSPQNSPQNSPVNKTHQNPSKPIETHQNPSKPIETHRNPPKPIKPLQNPIETHQNPSNPIETPSNPLEPQKTTRTTVFFVGKKILLVVIKWSYW